MAYLGLEPGAAMVGADESTEQGMAHIYELHAWVVVKLTHLLEALDHVCADVKVGIEGAEEEFSRLVRHVQDVVHDDVWKITFRWWWERKRQAMLLAVWPDWTIFWKILMKIFLTKTGQTFVDFLG